MGSKGYVGTSKGSCQESCGLEYRFDCCGNTRSRLMEDRHLFNGRFQESHYASDIDQYRICIEMADRVSGRRQSANNFYITVVSAVIAASQVVSSESSNILICLTGIAICALWRRSIQSYRDLNRGKFAVINRIEERLPLMPYNAEWEFLERRKSSPKYRDFTSTEVALPVIFIFIFVSSVVVELVV